MNLKTIVKIALLALLVLNGSLIYLLISSPDDSQRHGRMHPEKLGEGEDKVINLVSERLGLDEDQKKRYKEMAEAHHRDMKSLATEERNVIKSYLSYLKTEPDKTLSKSELRNLIEKLEGEKLSATFKHFEDLKMICDDQQIKKIDSVIEEMVLVILDGGKSDRPPPRN